MSAPQPRILETYNSLTDKHLVGYFSNARIRRHLQKSGLISRSGRIIPEREYRLNAIRRDHQRHVQECLADAIYHKVLDIEHHRQLGVNRRLDSSAGKGKVQPVKMEGLMGEVSYIYSPHPPVAPRSHHALCPLVSGERTGRSQRRGPRLRLDYGDGRYYYRSKEPAISKVGQGSEPRFRTPVQNMACLSPYQPTKRRRRVAPVPPPRPHVGDRCIPGIRRGLPVERWFHPTTAFNEQFLINNTNGFPKSPLCSNALVTMIYLGKSKHVSLRDHKDEIKVYQQYCGTENICVYKGDLLEGDTFQFISKRYLGYPFSLTFYLNGLQVDRLSCCCEYRGFQSKRPSRLRRRNTYFRVLHVAGAPPCYRCFLAMGLDKKLYPPKRKMKVPRRSHMCCCSPYCAHSLPCDSSSALQKSIQGSVSLTMPSQEDSVETIDETLDSEEECCEEEELEEEELEEEEGVEEEGVEEEGVEEEGVEEEVEEEGVEEEAEVETIDQSLVETEGTTQGTTSESEYDEDFEADEEVNEEGQTGDQMNGMSKSSSDDKKHNLDYGKESETSSQKALQASDSEKDKSGRYSGDRDSEDDLPERRPADSLSSMSTQCSTETDSQAEMKADHMNCKEDCNIKSTSDSAAHAHYGNENGEKKLLRVEGNQENSALEKKGIEEAEKTKPEDLTAREDIFHENIMAIQHQNPEVNGEFKQTGSGESEMNEEEECPPVPWESRVLSMEDGNQECPWCGEGGVSEDRKPVQEEIAKTTRKDHPVSSDPEPSDLCANEEEKNTANRECGASGAPDGRFPAGGRRSLDVQEAAGQAVRAGEVTGPGQALEQDRAAEGDAGSGEAAGKAAGAGAALSQGGTGDALPQDGTGAALPQGGTGDALPHGGTGDALPQGGTGDALPQDGTGDALPQDGTGDALPQRGTGDALSQRGTGDALPQGGTGDALAQDGTGDALPQRGTGDALPQDGTGDALPQRGTGDALPQRGTGDALPQGGTGDALPQGGTGDALPQGGTGDALPQDGTGDDLPQGGTGDALPHGGTGDALPQDGTGDALPQDGTGDALPHGGTGDALPQGGTGDALPQRGTGDALPQRGTGDALPQDGTGDALPQRGTGDALPHGGTGDALEESAPEEGTVAWEQPREKGTGEAEELGTEGSPGEQEVLVEGMDREVALGKAAAGALPGWEADRAVPQGQDGAGGTSEEEAAEEGLEGAIGPAAEEKVGEPGSEVGESLGQGGSAGKDTVVSAVSEGEEPVEDADVAADGNARAVGPEGKKAVEEDFSEGEQAMKKPGVLWEALGDMETGEAMPGGEGFVKPSQFSQLKVSEEEWMEMGKAVPGAAAALESAQALQRMGDTMEESEEADKGPVLEVAPGLGALGAARGAPVTEGSSQVEETLAVQEEEEDAAEALWSGNPSEGSKAETERAVEGKPEGEAVGGSAGAAGAGSGEEEEATAGAAGSKEPAAGTEGWLRCGQVRGKGRSPGEGVVGEAAGLCGTRAGEPGLVAIAVLGGQAGPGALPGGLAVPGAGGVRTGAMAQEGVTGAALGARSGAGAELVSATAGAAGGEPGEGLAGAPAAAGRAGKREAAGGAEARGAGPAGAQGPEREPGAEPLGPPGHREGLGAGAPGAQPAAESAPSAPGPGHGGVAPRGRGGSAGGEGLCPGTQPPPAAPGTGRARGKRGRQEEGMEQEQPSARESPREGEVADVAASAGEQRKRSAAGGSPGVPAAADVGESRSPRQGSANPDPLTMSSEEDGEETLL